MICGTTGIGKAAGAGNRGVTDGLDFMHGSLAAGAGLALADIVIAIAGYRHRNVIQRQRAALTWAPTIAPGRIGAAATVRF